MFSYNGAGKGEYCVPTYYFIFTFNNVYLLKLVKLHNKIKLFIDTYFIVGNGPQPSAKGRKIPDESG